MASSPCAAILGRQVNLNNQVHHKTGKSLLGKIAKSAVFAIGGFAAIAIPLHLLLKRELKDSLEDIRTQGWPIRVLQVLFARYILRRMDIEGLENLPDCSYVLASNHAYKSGVDGFLLGHLLVTKANRVPRIVITAESRNWVVRAERWVLHHYGIALLVPDEALPPEERRRGMSDVIAAYLRESSRHAVLIFPAGRAIADPLKQLENWSTGAVVSAAKSGCPVVPVAIGGLKLDWTPETVIFSAMDDDVARHPFRIYVRIGKPILPTKDARQDLETVRQAIRGLMQRIPAYQPAAGESDPEFGKISLRDGRTLAFMDRGPREGTPVIYFHGFQGSRLESFPGLRAVLARLNIRLISPDRPGIGLSTPARDRTVASWANDVRQLTEALLGAGKPFSIIGFSAGATYALGCGNLPGLKAVSLVSGMGLPHLIMNWRRYSQQAWRILLSAKLANFRSKTFLDVEKLHHDRVFDQWPTYYQAVRESLSEDDQRILQRPAVEALFRLNRREGYSQGPGSLLQEVQALYSDPHIDLAHLDPCTVLINHGSADRVVPVGVAQDLHESIPSSRLTTLMGRGHYFIYDEAEMGRIFHDLLAAHEACCCPPDVAA